VTLGELVRLLDPDGPAAERAVEVPPGTAAGGGEDPGFALLVGLLDEVIGEALAALPDEPARRRALAEALAGVEALASVARFELHGLRERIRRDELAARAREREIAMTEGWLLPRLRGDVAVYEERLAALRAALGGS
jgi:hypothetical protein